METGLGSGCVVNVAKEAIYIYNLSQVGGQHWTSWAWLTPEESLGKVDSSVPQKEQRLTVCRSPCRVPPPLDLSFQMVPRVQFLFC